MKKKRILLLSAYDALSHRYWHQNLIKQFPQHDWHVLALKDRYFAWRMGANALNFKAQYDAQLSVEYDLLIATSMTDLSTLLGLYPHLSKLPKHLYFHENQFAYPVNDNQQGLLEIQIRTIYAALAADQLTFNTNYNLATWQQGVAALCQKMPDGLPKDLLAQLSQKSSCLAVPIDDDCQPNNHLKLKSSDGLQVVWNHRWEHDKGPETLLELMRLCQDKKPNIQFHVLGQKFRKIPEAMKIIEQNHPQQCLNLGFIDSRTQYIQVLQTADVVLSTAFHDFQGIAMLEASACGCLAIAPNRLVYPEWYPATNLYPSTPSDPKAEAHAIFALLQNSQKLQATQFHPHWQTMKPNYQNWLSSQSPNS
ncbi:tRNA-queuosine alpha-mannosyltransferase domain-containing protein [Marinicella litoralis]|uniref:tRNA-queuosine alpha-mannosyltransferase n=1 Tax=Marinicella litoralis TaxID=644220 RepID=A0A4R6XUW9_9GAMM|nr:DUF3524 domain-containing protein [Marinicella litoralis]TDR23805.1 glycosyl transferase family 1 [Marinicella litoralis]